LPNHVNARLKIIENLAQYFKLEDGLLSTIHNIASGDDYWMINFLATAKFFLTTDTCYI